VSRAFVSEFLLPLVAGGNVEVGRPLSRRDVETLMRVHSERPHTGERDAAQALALARQRALMPLVATLPALELDEPTWRLGAAVHNLLAMAHPRIASGPGAESRVERVAAAAASLAALGAPKTVGDTLERHSVVARLPEVVRVDHTVRYWLGRKTFVGRRPPARMLALPAIRGVKVESMRRAWLRDVGVQTAARPAFAALTDASPLGEALDPLRLDPPPSWGRLLSALRFPVLCRLVAGRLVEIGVAPVGDALADALYRFGSLQDTAGPVPASPDAVGFAIGFLAHLTWLTHLFDSSLRVVGRVAKPVPAGGPSKSHGGAGAGGGADVAGRELAVLLAAAEQVDANLIWPPDVPRGSDLGRGFAQTLARLFDRHQVKSSTRWAAASELAERAAVAARSHRAGNAV
jgi:hypothetical protein